jgi:hypothetical protein
MSLKSELLGLGDLKSIRTRHQFSDSIFALGYRGIPLGYRGIPLGYRGIPLGYRGIPLGYCDVHNVERLPQFVDVPQLMGGVQLKLAYDLFGSS